MGFLDVTYDIFNKKHCVKWLPHVFVCAGQRPSWCFLERPAKSQAGGRRGGGWGGVGKQWELAHDSGALGPLIIQQWRGWGVRGGLSPLSVPQSQIHSWYPPQKRWQWLAGERAHTHTHTHIFSQSSWELPFHMAEAKPVWPTPPPHPLKSQCRKKSHNKEAS